MKPNQAIQIEADIVTRIIALKRQIEAGVTELDQLCMALRLTYNNQLEFIHDDTDRVLVSKMCAEQMETFSDDEIERVFGMCVAKTFLRDKARAWRQMGVTIEMIYAFVEVSAYFEQERQLKETRARLHQVERDLLNASRQVDAQCECAGCKFLHTTYFSKYANLLASFTSK